MDLTYLLAQGLCLFSGCLFSVNKELCLYLEDVTLCELKGAGSDVDAFACLDLNVVYALVAVVIVHRIVW